MTAKHLLPLLACFALTGLVSTAAGDETSDAETQALEHFDRGRELLKKKRYGVACAAFTSSVAINPSVGAYLNLGECNEKLDRIASAKRAFDDAATLAKNQRDSKRAAYAAKRARKLAPRVSYLRIAVGPAERSDALVVTLNGDTVAPADLGGRIALDIGSHKLTAVRGDGARFRKTVRIAEEASETRVAVSFPESQPRSNAEPASTGLSGTVKLQVEPPEEARSGGRGRALPLSLLAGAAVAAGAGTFFGISARDRWNQARLCQETRCRSTDAQLADSARTRAHIATVLFGVAAISAGVSTWLLVAGGGGEPAESRPISVSVGPASATVSVAF